MSEHATIQYVLENTNMPVPQVLAHEATNENELQFEWMIMERVQGLSISSQDHGMSWMKKELLVRKVVSYLVQLFNQRFTHIGNLYSYEDLSQEASQDEPVPVAINGAKFALSNIVSVPFFLGDHINTPNLPRGIFRSSQAWLAARLQLALLDAEAEVVEAIESWEDEDDDSEVKHAKDHVSNTHRLIKLLPKIFPEDRPEEFILHHHDLNVNNILVNPETHDIEGIIDWECIQTTPLWLACQLPKFLISKDRDELPDSSLYAHETKDDGTEGINELYWEHLEEYEKTQLRKFFFEEMQRQCPEWIKEFKASSLKADFEDAIDQWFASNYVTSWLKWVEAELEAGRDASDSQLRDRMLNPKWF